MKTKNLIFALTISTTFLLNGCSMREEVSPASGITEKIDVPVRVINNRLVFKNEEVFNKVGEELQKKDYAELKKWENENKFISLWSTYEKEINKFEELDKSNANLVAYNLIEEFGFPRYYATVISPKGEYQIGNHIYWFHKNYKYVTDSESELQMIKDNPENFSNRSWAGITSFKKEEKISFNNTTNSTTHRV